MKFRLSIFFLVNQFASRYFSQPVSADQIWKILSIIPSLTVKSSVTDVIFKTSYKKSGGTAKTVGFGMSAELKKMATEFTTMYRQKSQTTN